MRYVPRVPEDGPLAEIVEVMFSLDSYAPPHARERIVPNGRTTLVIELDDRPRSIYDNESGERIQACRHAWISGVHRDRLVIGDTDSESRLCAIQFRPGWARCVIPRDLADFNDRVIPAFDVYGPSVLDLREALLIDDDPTAILDRLQTWLDARCDISFAPPAVVRDAVTALLDDPGAVKLGEFVEAHGTVSYKHFGTLFQRHVGPSPKTFQRILRFAHAFAMLQGKQEVDWASLSHDLGYADQAHFIRDFRSFSGYRPQRFLKAGHERLNFFPEDDDR